MVWLRTPIAEFSCPVDEGSALHGIGPASRACPACAGSGRVNASPVFEWSGDAQAGRYRAGWRLCPLCQGSRRQPGTTH